MMRRKGMNVRWLNLMATWALACASMTASAGVWMEDFDAAVAKSKEENKQVLLVFSGMDGDQWSDKLDAEVLDQDEFTSKAAQDFILVRIKLPLQPKKREEASEEERKRYELAGDFLLTKLPCIYLCTPDGQPYNATDYQEGGIEGNLKKIEDMRKSHDDAMQLIENSEGPERAKLIEEWLQTIPAPIHPLFEDEMNMIIASDPNNETGLWHKYKMQMLLPKAYKARASGQLDEAEAIYMQLLNEVKPEGEELQKVYYELGDVYYQRRDYEKLLRNCRLAIEAAPEGNLVSILNEMTEVFTKQYEEQKQGHSIDDGTSETQKNVVSEVEVYETEVEPEVVTPDVKSDVYITTPTSHMVE
ncbi:thioredoxin family protein [Candidatus Sumerlaeota bacterium]|nr:thioredoxin family protein [Candidatus Sumerlaeota bacterium]